MLIPNTGDQSEVPEAWSDRKAKKFAKEYGLNVMSKTKKKVRWTVTCDKVVLHDDFSPYADFTIVPFFAYFRRGRPFGMVRNLLSPQEQLNKIASQELHIVNTTANSGWVVESGSLTNMQAEDLEEHGAETGLVLSTIVDRRLPRRYNLTRSRPVSIVLVRKLLRISNQSAVLMTLCLALMVPKYQVLLFRLNRIVA